MKIILTIAIFVGLFLFAKFVLPHLIKRQRIDDPFILRDRDIKNFWAYCFPDNYIDFQSFCCNNRKDKNLALNIRKKIMVFEALLFEKYPEYYEHIEKNFIKNYFG